MSTTKGIHHIALKACGKEAFERTCAFYEMLGCPTVRTWGEGEGSAAMLKCGESLFEIFANGTEEGCEGALRHMALATDDVDACIEKVRAAGYKITMPPTDIVIPAETPYPARIAFCEGPVGESVEFFCEK